MTEKQERPHFETPPAVDSDAETQEVPETEVPETEVEVTETEVFEQQVTEQWQAETGAQVTEEFVATTQVWEGPSAPSPQPAVTSAGQEPVGGPEWDPSAAPGANPAPGTWSEPVSDAGAAANLPEPGAEQSGQVQVGLLVWALVLVLIGVLMMVAGVATQADIEASLQAVLVTGLTAAGIVFIALAFSSRVRTGQ